MNAEDLRELLEKSQDKLNIFKDKNILSQYSFNMYELVSLVNDFLNDEEKAILFEFDYFLSLPKHIKTILILSISNDSIKLELITNHDIISEFTNHEIVNMVESLGDDHKIEILHNSVFIEENNIEDFHIQKMIKSLSEEKRQKILFGKDFIEQELHLQQSQIADIICSFESDEIKTEIIEKYDCSDYLMVCTFRTFSDSNKEKIILENKYEFNNGVLATMISTLSTDSIVDFIKNNKKFLDENKISTYEITRELAKEKQLEFMSRFEEMNLNLEEKRKILATLDQVTKDSLDTKNFPQEYVSAIEMYIDDKFDNVNSIDKIIIDFTKDLNIYQGLDELIYLNPIEVSNENRTKLFKLLEICPEIKIYDNIGLCSSTVQEYKNAEAWIESVLQDINPEWTDIQKLAFIDNAIGKKISYSPDFDTEVSDEDAARALWKIINSGYGVCNGIAQVEKYILDKVGIEAEMVSGVGHSFLKIKNIEIPNAEGGSTRGDTILDPTWNLTAHRYGAFPDNFCKSYEEIRKHDIRASDGKDLECHKNDEEPDGATIDLDEQTLRKVFTSIGLADRDGNFPIKTLIDKSKAIDDLNLPTVQAIEKQFLLLSSYYPEFAICQNETSSILQGTILNQENLKFNKCVVNRVYSREDENKRPVLYVYVDLPDSGKKFYLADKDSRQFLEIPQKEFESRYECYEMDMEEQNGYRPWEGIEEKESLEDLTKSSGKVVDSEGDVR